MGAYFDFTCAGCGYTARVSGGRDVGMLAVIRTMTCDSCKTLVDVLIGQCGKEVPTGDPEYDKDLNLCPECRSRNVRPWPPRKRPCPKCGVKMAPNLETKLLWD